MGTDEIPAHGGVPCRTEASRGGGTPCREGVAELDGMMEAPEGWGKGGSLSRIWG